MAPRKRGRPAFSPPRPGKSKAASSGAKGRDAKGTNAKKRALGESNKRNTGSARKRGRPLRNSDEEDEDHNSEDLDNGRSALALVDMQADDDDEGLSSDEEEDENPDDDPGTSSRRRHGPQGSSSPEPDMILAEITTTADEPSTSAIPHQLVHKLLAYHFEKKEKTKITVDARDLVTKYLEVFVREAIMRSAFEKDERHTREGGGAGGDFLEVEDLERAAVQLCLDF